MNRGPAIEAAGSSSRPQKDIVSDRNSTLIGADLAQLDALGTSVLVAPSAHHPAIS